MLPLSERTSEAFWKGIELFAFPTDPTFYFANYYKPVFPEGTKNGWNIYEAEKEDRKSVV